MDYIFFGRTFSNKGILFDIKDPPIRGSMSHPTIGNFNFTLHLNGTSDIIFRIESTSEIKDIPTLFDIARFYVQSFYDTALLTGGVLCTVIFTSLLLPGNQLAQLDVNDVSSWLQPHIFDQGTEKLFKLKDDPFAKIAITDIKFACVEPELTALFAFRSIEDIRNSFGKEEDDNKIKWNLLRENLNIHLDFFDKPTKLSKYSRHGEVYIQSFNDRQVCIYSSMIVLQRYLHYLDQGRKKLDIKDFPELKTVEEFGIKL